MGWTRISTDVDDQGHCTGLSYQRHEDDVVVTIHVMTHPGPFETPVEALERALEAVLDRYGVQMRLFD